MNVIANGPGLQHLNLLLEFLAAWQKRPVYLTPMAYQWCSTISEAAERLRLREVPVNPPPNLPELESQLLSKLEPQISPQCACQVCHYHQSHPRPRPQDLINSDFPTGAESLSSFAEREFSHVGPGCDPIRVCNTSHHACGCPQNIVPLRRIALLPIILDIGFHFASHGSALSLNHTRHHEWMFKVAFTSNNDEVIADAVTMWITGSDQTPLDSFVSYFAKRVESNSPFSPRLRQVTIRAIEPILRQEFEVSGLETVRLLNCLNVGVDDMTEKRVLALLLAEVVCSPAELGSLSPHYWHLLDELALGIDFSGTPGVRSLEMIRSLKEAEDSKKLETWVVIVWQSLPGFVPDDTMEAVERATLELLLQRPSALPRFEILCEQGSLWRRDKLKLRRICNQAQTERLALESPLPPYVSVHPTLHLPVLMPSFSLLQSIDSRPVTHSPPFCGRRHLLKFFVVYVPWTGAQRVRMRVYDFFGIYEIHISRISREYLAKCSNVTGKREGGTNTLGYIPGLSVTVLVMLTVYPLSPIIGGPKVEDAALAGVSTQPH
jgi:hypothetical protein